jgi:hypothetical protein
MGTEVGVVPIFVEAGVVLDWGGIEIQPDKKTATKRSTMNILTFPIMPPAELFESWPSCREHKTQPYPSN